MAYIGKKPTAAPLTSSDVADGIITNAKLAQDIISADTALGAEPADTDEFLVSDAGVLKRMDYSYIKGGGKVGQVVQTVKTTITSATGSSGTWYDVTGMSVAITPAATSSKILVMLDAKSSQKTGYAVSVKVARDIGGAGYGDIYVSTDSLSSQEDATYMTAEDGNESSHIMSSYVFLDSPSTTSACTYKMQWQGESSQTHYLNRTYNDGNFNYKSRGASSITVMEILA